MATKEDRVPYLAGLVSLAFLFIGGTIGNALALLIGAPVAVHAVLSMLASAAGYFAARTVLRAWFQRSMDPDSAGR